MNVYKLMKEYKKSKMEMQLKTLLDVATKIRITRESKDITQEELASMCDLSRTTITNIEGAKQDLTITALVSIAIALEVDITYLIPSIKQAECSKENEL